LDNPVPKKLTVMIYLKSKADNENDFKNKELDLRRTEGGNQTSKRAVCVGTPRTVAAA
jgi:hypothetical protein